MQGYKQPHRVAATGDGNQDPAGRDKGSEKISGRIEDGMGHLGPPQQPKRLCSLATFAFTAGDAFG
ncbi:hypothetical protein EME01_38610 [Sinorhizobium meliloti]|nr:hypothetical protein EME01_38610 [Sinorhizobium meliloti]